MIEYCPCLCIQQLHNNVSPTQQLPAAQTTLTERKWTYLLQQLPAAQTTLTVRKWTYLLQQLPAAQTTLTVRKWTYLLQQLTTSSSNYPHSEKMDVLVTTLTTLTTAEVVTK